MRQVHKHRGTAPAEVECPDDLWYVWKWFVELSASRVGTGFGVAPITYQEREAWARVTGRKPALFEWALIGRLDTMYREAMS